MITIIKFFNNPLKDRSAVRVFRDRDLLHSLLVDKEYTVIGTHLDDNMKHRIAGR